MYSTMQGSGLLHHTRITLFIVFSVVSSGFPASRVSLVLLVHIYAQDAPKKMRRNRQLRKMEATEI